MSWLVIALSAGVMLILAIGITYVLVRANRAWQVHVDPVVEQVEQALAGLDCGQCGYPTCNAYAEAIVSKHDAIDKCRPGGARSAHEVADILGVERPEVGDHFAVVHCGATWQQRKGVAPYKGEQTCAAANVLGGTQACVYGCLGLGDCERSCPFDAIHVIDGLAVVDFSKCTACGNCVRACPRDIITIEHFKAPTVVVVACCNKDPGKDTRSVCQVGCIACGICQRACDLFVVRMNLSRLDYQRYDPDGYADQLQEASNRCPTGCLPYRGKGVDVHSAAAQQTRGER